ncbi:hypothetical protein K437DRAFT_43848 [Tilletiaria anomala UBC 951]|uniref:Uncharacterized protein n=1 Tax=Tilletiaria anomala (strain ATCC 24038 / CBS 436.72 / UBC 951) TaxID=1037660 RepID=A0A066V9Z1_TILAU|nr:uncharacterized protein K437DRAFT_43848 [Tilletiaria anomala UBC 951]KDN37118.1 hypothetical protein K437DRAFT_43848 [Tilletiaria anomala UBC 951]
MYIITTSLPGACCLVGLPLAPPACFIESGLTTAARKLELGRAVTKGSSLRQKLKRSHRLSQSERQRERRNRRQSTTRVSLGLPTRQHELEVIAIYLSTRLNPTNKVAMFWEHGCSFRCCYIHLISFAAVASGSLRQFTAGAQSADLRCVTFLIIMYE